jgi:hypothetical protein
VPDTDDAEMAHGSSYGAGTETGSGATLNGTAEGGRARVCCLCLRPKSETTGVLSTKTERRRWEERVTAIVVQLLVNNGASRFGSGTTVAASGIGSGGWGPGERLGSGWATGLGLDWAEGFGDSCQVECC